MVAHEVHSNSRFAIQEAFNRPAEVAREYPVTSMLVVFGVGLGVGVLLSQVACSTLENLYEEPSFATRMSRQIASAINEVIPETVSRQFASFQR